MDATLFQAYSTPHVAKEKMGPPSLVILVAFLILYRSVKRLHLLLLILRKNLKTNYPSRHPSEMLKQSKCPTHISILFSSESMPSPEALSEVLISLQEIATNISPHPPLIYSLIIPNVNGLVKALLVQPAKSLFTVLECASAGDLYYEVIFDEIPCRAKMYLFIRYRDYDLFVFPITRPELLLCLDASNDLCLHGYPCYLLRDAEICHTKGNALYSQCIYEGIKFYASTVQRFGK
jgi:hypothetical protein